MHILKSKFLLLGYSASYFLSCRNKTQKDISFCIDTTIGVILISIFSQENVTLFPFQMLISIKFVVAGSAPFIPELLREDE